MEILNLISVEIFVGIFLSIVAGIILKHFCAGITKVHAIYIIILLIFVSVIFLLLKKYCEYGKHETVFQVKNNNKNFIEKVINQGCRIIKNKSPRLCADNHKKEIIIKTIVKEYSIKLEFCNSNNKTEYFNLIKTANEQLRYGQKDKALKSYRNAYTVCPNNTLKCFIENFNKD
jgi:hypothetical protein